MTEAEVQAAAIAALNEAGAFPEPYHTHCSKRSPAGFPDICACVDGVLWFIEVKAEHGVLSTEQLRWGAQLTDLVDHRAVKYMVVTEELLPLLRRRLGLPGSAPRATETGGKVREAPIGHPSQAEGRTGDSTREWRGGWQESIEPLRVDPDDPREQEIHQVIHELGVPRARAEEIVAHNARRGG